MPVTKPYAKYIRRNYEIHVREAQRCRNLNRVIQALISDLAMHRGGNLASRLHGRQRALTAVPVVSDRSRLRGLARCAGVGKPTVLRVGDNRRSVIESDLVTRPAVHDPGGRDD